MIEFAVTVSDVQIKLPDVFSAKKLPVPVAMKLLEVMAISASFIEVTALLVKCNEVIELLLTVADVQTKLPLSSTPNTKPEA